MKTGFKKKLASAALALGMVAGTGAVAVATAAPASAASYRSCHSHYTAYSLSGPAYIQYCQINYTVAERWHYGSARPYGWNWYSRVTWTQRWGYMSNSFHLDYHTPHSGYWY